MPPNGAGIELPAARDLTMSKPTAARPRRVPMRAAGNWRGPARPRRRPVSSDVLLGRRERTDRDVIPVRISE